MTFKALTPLLDPVLGQNVELGLCVGRMEVREMPLTIANCEGALHLTLNRVKE